MISSINPGAQILIGTAIAAALVVTIQHPGLAKTAQQVAEIAEAVTVQVNSGLGDGSGVIVAKAGTVYAVLTVNHVVEDPNAGYSIRTSTGATHQATRITRLQTSNTEPDLAVIEFESPQDYSVATLGDSDQAVIGAQIYVYGYPATGGLTGVEREPELSPGLVTSRPKSRPEGYNLRYQAVTWSGMSGGPVFDIEGRVVGLHGQGEFGFAQTSSGDVTPIKTGFNAAIPINLFVNQLSNTKLAPDSIRLDPAPIPQPAASDIQADAQGLYFQGLTFLDQDNAWEAIASFNQALALDPDSPEIYFYRGIARSLLAVNEPTRSPSPIEDYSEAIRLNPGYADAYYNRALVYFGLNQPERAIADLKQAAELYRQLGRADAYKEALQKLETLRNQ